MKSPDVDVVIVGARCAGAPLATFLARAGARVLLLDRASLPSDQVLSTHTIHPPGMDVLDELGVGADVRSVAPPVRRARLVKGEAWVDGEFGDGRSGCCPRRKRLDGLLQDAAVEAGVELRDRARVVDVLFRAERVVGVRLRRNGTTTEVRAGLVVGADGRRSTVAARVGAAEYLTYPAPRAMYWVYWDAPDAWGTDAFPFDMYLAHRDEHVRVIFQTDHGQLLLGSLPTVREARTWRKDPLASLRQSLARDPVTHAIVGGSRPAGRVRGTLMERFYFREGAGPGWALAGDAGHHKDFVIGDGITEALLQARSLAAAIGEGTDRALQRWWRARDVEALPSYFWGREEGSAGSPGVLQAAVFERLRRRPDAGRLLAGLPEHRASPYDVLPPGPVLGALTGCLLRGRLGALREFVARGRRAAEFRRERGRRERLLEEVAA